MEDNWYCIYTKPHCEDYVAQYLLDKWQIETFSPRLKTKKYIKGRMKEAAEALFPCYIFSRFDPVKHYHMIRRVIGDQCGNPYVVDNEVIGQIQSRMEEGFINVDPSHFSEGEPIVVQEGALQGFAGVFQKELKASDRVMILLNTVAYQATVEIERGLLERV
jgi:transcription antitermination factor NusG